MGGIWDLDLKVGGNVKDEVVGGEDGGRGGQQCDEVADGVCRRRLCLSEDKWCLRSQMGHRVNYVPLINIKKRKKKKKKIWV